MSDKDKHEHEHEKEKEKEKEHEDKHEHEKEKEEKEKHAEKGEHEGKEHAEAGHAEEQNEVQSAAGEAAGAGGQGADFTVTGYVWKGLGAYDKSVSVHLTDDDNEMDWFGREEGARARISVDGGDAHDVYGGGMYRFEFTTPEGEEIQEDMLTFYAHGVGWVLVPEADSAFSEGCRITRLRGWQEMGDTEYADVVCFTPSSLILTPQGEVPAAALRPGDRVITADGGARPVIWAGQSFISPARRMRENLHPVRLRAGAFGEGRPWRDLWVSPQHRFCITGPRLMLDFALEEAMVPALSLIDGRRVARIRAAQPVRYVHLLLEGHHVLFANGLPCESLHPGPQALAALSPPARRDLLARLGSGASARGMGTARPCLRAREAARLARHLVPAL